MGPAYLRYSFTKGTEQEVDFLVEALGLRPGCRVLDVGCGPGRHALALAARGIEVHGVDIAPAFVDEARKHALPGASFEVADARHLAFDASFDAVISLCQGGFGLVGADDSSVLRGMAAAVRPGGRLALSAFSAYFALRYLEDGDHFDAARGENLEQSVLRDSTGGTTTFPLRTSCFTPRELRLLCAAAGLEVDHLWSVAPGRYRGDDPTIESPEFLVVATRPPLAG